MEHITALVALYRPGPMDLIPDFIKRRHGKVEIKYEHPLLEEISEETYGILIYQEQVMQATQLLAGYSLGSADLLRRAMGKKKLEEMAKQRKSFVAGCKETNSIPEAQANKIFDLLEKFAGYGFNKSHAPPMPCGLSNGLSRHAHYRQNSFRLCTKHGRHQQAHRLDQRSREGIDVLPPDINESQVDLLPRETAPVIRHGLAAIKGGGSRSRSHARRARR